MTALRPVSDRNLFWAISLIASRIFVRDRPDCAFLIPSSARGGSELKGHSMRISESESYNQSNVLGTHLQEGIAPQPF